MYQSTTFFAQVELTLGGSFEASRLVFRSITDGYDCNSALWISFNCLHQQKWWHYRKFSL